MAPSKPIDAFRRATARRLRANATNAEMLLWRQLRQIETQGTHFRRQVPIGRYIADFACLAARLVIELDGSQHADPLQSVSDEDRTRWFKAEGYRVIRFWNNDVTGNIDSVLETIYAALYGSRDIQPNHLKHLHWHRNHPTPARFARRPSPSRGG